MPARRTRLSIVVALAASALVVAGPAPRAEAAAVASVDGTVLTITATGDGDVRPTCTGGAGVNGVAAQPVVPCASVTAVIVNGDAGDQVVDGRPIDGPSFGAVSAIEVHGGGGEDLVFESDGADVLDLGPGDDTLVLRTGGAANASIDLGPDVDDAVLNGTPADDQVVATSTGATVELAVPTDEVGSGHVVANAEVIQFQGFAGNDAFDTSGVVGASTVQRVFGTGNDGDDTFESGPRGMFADGSTGANTYLGGAGDDIVLSSSGTDVIHLGGGHNEVRDVLTFRSGGRQITGSGSSDTYRTELDSQDTVVRVRPGPVADAALVTASLGRTGQQALAGTFDRIAIDLAPFDKKLDRSLVDVRALHQAVDVAGDTGKDDVIDITVPAGAWEKTVGEGGTVTVDPADPAYGTVTVTDPGPVSVHGPWTNANEGFAHRAIRDLQFRVAPPAERTQIRNALAANTTSRAAVVQKLVASDTYRGIDVDRAFVEFLDRQSDASGRAYWVASLSGGKSLTTFRAQLFGSNEYYVRSGSTATSFVRSAYRDVLGRYPDGAGLIYWVNKINGGTGRGAVAKQFLLTGEARRSVVEDQFLRFLDRGPTPAESAAWAAVLEDQPQGEPLLVASLAGGQEYFLRT